MELLDLSKITLPRHHGREESSRQLHVFCDASERAYGSVAYLRCQDASGQVSVSFLMARSKVAPKRQLSMPRLELSAALSGAQLAHLLQGELTLPIESTFLWSDSTTVLLWMNSDSCSYKVFVGTRIAEIQELTPQCTWGYVDSATNPADDLTRGKSLLDLSPPNRWHDGPPFLQQPPTQWPQRPTGEEADNKEELRKSVFCGLIQTTAAPAYPEPSQFSSFQTLLEATARVIHGAADPSSSPTADDFREAERIILQQAQEHSFKQEITCLKAGKPVPPTSRLICLAPELDSTSQLIRVGGRLRQADQLDADSVHPIVLDPKDPATKLLIQDVDEKLCHPGSERVFSELRRKYWVLRGRQAIRQYQHGCFECQQRRAKVKTPKMADLPSTRLRLHKPAFYSSGVDCFGPYAVKVGRRTEKRWGIIYKCLTTRAVYLDLLGHIDTDAFLMSLRRFIARRGQPFEIISDQGTNFKGGERELREAFSLLAPDLQAKLAKQQIRFQFNPPNAPHFGGVWEREIRTLKNALHVTLGAQSVSEEVLRTVLVEIEGILNSKPLGYTSADISDPDPIIPNILLMGRPDPSLPQVVYADTELLGRRQWRHSQVLADQFWARFTKDYLPSLQSRQKWQRDTPNLAVDSTVMIVDPQLPRALWPVGKVERVYPGSDGRIRVADVRTKDRTYTQPVARLVELPPLPEATNNAPV